MIEIFFSYELGLWRPLIRDAIAQSALEVFIHTGQITSRRSG